jgi:hypothetical protein
MRASVLVALVLAAAGCGESPRFATSEPIRLIGDPGIRRDAPFLAWGTVVSIGDVPRPVLSAAAPVVPPSELLPQPNGRRKIRAQIPPEFARLPWLVYETTVTRDGATSMLRSWPVTAKVSGTFYEVWVTEEKVGPHDTPGVRLWPIPDLASRDVETGDVAIPVGATLEVGLGLEPITWDTTVIPVEMTVTALAAGRETVLSTTPVTPPQRPAPPQWKDVSIPLDALAGQTVRLRFSARPKMGPSAVVSLPVWADPTIVVARRAAAR